MERGWHRYAIGAENGRRVGWEVYLCRTLLQEGPSGRVGEIGGGVGRLKGGLLERFGGNWQEAGGEPFCWWNWRGFERMGRKCGQLWAGPGQ